MTHPTMQRIFDKTGKTAAEIARILDTTPQSINNWSSRGISKRGALDAARVFNLSVDWILTGEGEVSTPIRENQINESDTQQMGFWDSETPLQDDEFEVSFTKIPSF